MSKGKTLKSKMSSFFRRGASDHKEDETQLESASSSLNLPAILRNTSSTPTKGIKYDYWMDSADDTIGDELTTEETTQSTSTRNPFGDHTRGVSSSSLHGRHRTSSSGHRLSQGSDESSGSAVANEGDRDTRTASRSGPHQAMTDNRRPSDSQGTFIPPFANEGNRQSQSSQGSGRKNSGVSGPSQPWVVAVRSRKESNASSRTQKAFPPMGDRYMEMKNAERDAELAWEKARADAQLARARAETEARLTGQMPKSTAQDPMGYAGFSGQDRTSSGKGRAGSEQPHAGSSKVEPKKKARIPSASEDRQVAASARGSSSSQGPSSNRVPSGGRPLPSLPPLKAAASTTTLRGSDRSEYARQAPSAVSSSRTPSGQNVSITGMSSRIPSGGQNTPIVGMSSRVASGSHGPALSSPVSKQHQAVHASDVHYSPLRSSPFRRADDEPAYAINLDRDTSSDSDADLNLTAAERAVIKKYKAAKEEQRRSQEEATGSKHRSADEDPFGLSQEAAMAKEVDAREMAASGIDPVEFQRYKDSGLSLDEWMEFKASGIDFDDYVQWKDSGLELDEWMDLNLSGLPNQEYADVKKIYRMSVMEFAEQKSSGLTAQEFVGLRKLGITAREFVDVSKNRLSVQQFLEEQKAFESLTSAKREQCHRSSQSATLAGQEYLPDAAEQHANSQYELAVSSVKAPTTAHCSAESYAKEYQASMAPTIAEYAKGSVLSRKISPLDLLKRLVSPLSQLSVDDEKVEDDDQDSHYDSDGTDSKSFMCPDAREHDHIQKKFKGKDTAAKEDDARSITSFGSYGCVGLEDEPIWERQVAKEPHVWEDTEYEAAYQSARIELDLESLAKAANLAYFDAYEREDVKDKFGRDIRPDDVVAAAHELALVSADNYSKAADAAGKLAYARVYGDRDYRDREFRDRVELQLESLNLDENNSHDGSVEDRD